MATRDGYRIAKELEKKGWTIQNEPEIIGDPQLIDPVTKRKYTPHQADTIQKEREYFELYNYE